jgi:hypothetical protein
MLIDENHVAFVPKIENRKSSRTEKMKIRKGGRILGEML